jgi:autotransporter-associated beta strand protein
VTSSTPATLTINNSSDFTFGGATISTTVGTVGSLTSAQIQGNLALTKSGTGTFTLGGTLAGGATPQGNTHTGPTKILGGILVLGESTSLRNSPFDTAASITGDASNGLRISTTNLTLGGLTGNKNFADVFETTSGGYSALTALTLNPGTGATPSYAADIGDGAGGLTLTKTGAGTQVLAGPMSHTGATTVNAGTLTLDYSTQDNSKLSDTAPLVLGGGTLNLTGGTHAESVLSTTLTAGTTSFVTSSGAAPLQMNSITVGAGARVDFAASGIATTDNLNNAYGVLGGWATVNGVLAVNSTNSADGLITAATSSDVTRLDGGLQIIPDSAGTNIRIVEGTGTPANITLAAATTTINTLFQSTSGGTSAATIDSGTQTLRTNSIFVESGAGALTIGNGTLSTATAGGDLELSPAALTNSITIDSVIANNTSASSLTKNGLGTVTLNGANTYDGATISTNGVLSITNNDSLGSTVGSTTINGGVSAGGFDGSVLRFTDATTDLTLGENINLFGNVNGRALLINSSAQNHTLNGALDVSSDTNLSHISSNSTGSITINSDITGTMANGAVLFLRGASTNPLNRVLGSVNLTGGNLAKTDAGTWLVGAPGESYSWANTQLAVGTIVMGTSGVLPASSVLFMGNSTGSSAPVLDLNGFNQTSAGLVYAGAGTATGTKTITNAGLDPAVFTINNTTDYVSGNVVGANNIVLTGNLGLTKQGAGKLTLLGTNTHTGATTVTEGTLVVNGSIDNSLVSLNGGTLTGSGTIFNGVTVANTASTILSNNDGTAGASLTIGALTFDGAATVNTFSNSTSAPIVATTSLTSNAAGTVTINPSAPNWTTGSTYELINYGGGIIGGAGFGQFALGTVSGLSPRQATSALADTGTAITITISADPPKWTGLDNGSWQTGSTGTNENWRLQAAETATAYINGDDVLFDDTATGTTAVDISTANVSPASTTFNNSSLNYTLTGTNGIATGGLTKNGTGTVTIGTANTYTGQTNVNDGLLEFTGSSSYSPNGTGDVGGEFNVNGATAVASIAGTYTATGNGNAFFQISNGGTLNFSGTASLQGTAGIRIGEVGNGTMNMTGGSITANLASTANLVLGRNASTGGTLNLSGGTFSVNTGGIVLANNATASALVNLGGTGELAITSTQNFSLGAGTATLNLNSGGTLTLGSPMTADASGTSTINFDGGTLKVATLTTTIPATVTAANILDGGLIVNTDGNDLTIAEDLLHDSGLGATPDGGLIKTGLGTLTLSGFNTYTGNTVINGGTVSVAADTNLGAAPASATPGSLVINGGALAATTGFTLDSNRGLALGPDSGSGNGTINVATGETLTYAGIAANNGGGTGGLIKTGAGTLTLSGANTYTGNTTVNAGIVNISGNHSAATGSWNINGDSTVNFLVGSVVVLGSGKNIILANSDSSAVFNLNAFGTVTTSATSDLDIRGRRTVNLESGANWTQSGPLAIQPLNTTYSATMNVKTGSSFTYDGTTTIRLARASGGGNGSGTLNLSGGIFTTSRGFSNTAAGTGSGNTNLTFTNGGTLKLSADIASLIIQGASDFRVNVNTGGGIIDTNGFSTAISVPILGTGDLTKTGAGTLTLSGTSTYAGTTTLSGGTLALGANDALPDTTNITLGAATLNAETYTDTVGTLDVTGSATINLGSGAALAFADSSAVGGGNWSGTLNLTGTFVPGASLRFGDGTGTGLTATQLDAISASGWTDFSLDANGYLIATAVGGDSFTTWAGEKGLDGTPGKENGKADDPDKDGINNLQEFAFNGDPLDPSDNGMIAGFVQDTDTPADTDELTLIVAVRNGATFSSNGSPAVQTATVDGVVYTIEGSLDLATIPGSAVSHASGPSNTAPAGSGLTVDLGTSGWKYHTFKLDASEGLPDKGFLRAKVSE